MCSILSGLFAALNIGFRRSFLGFRHASTLKVQTPEPILLPPGGPSDRFFPVPNCLKILDVEAAGVIPVLLLQHTLTHCKEC